MSKSASCVLALLLTLGCSRKQPTDPPIDGVGNIGIVYGTVVNFELKPVEGVSVNVQRMDPVGECVTVVEGSSIGFDHTNQDGSYRVRAEWVPLSPEYRLCLEVTATPPNDLNLKPEIVTAIPLIFRSPNLPSDSVAIDFILNPMD